LEQKITISHTKFPFKEPPKSFFIQYKFQRNSSIVSLQSSSSSTMREGCIIYRVEREERAQESLHHLSQGFAPCGDGTPRGGSHLS